MELWILTRTGLYLWTRVCTRAVLFGGLRRHAVRAGPTLGGSQGNINHRPLIRAVSSQLRINRFSMALVYSLL